MRSRHVLLVAATLAVAGPVLAEDMGYSYLQLELQSGALRSSGEATGGEGAGLSSAFELSPAFFLSMDSATISYLDTGLGLRLESDSLGLGAHTALGTTLDLVGGISLEHLKARLVGVAGSEAEWGWGANIGLRGQIGEKIQWATGVRYQDVGDFQSIVGFHAGGHYYLSPAFAMGVQFSARKHDQDALDSRELILSLSFRYHFGEGAQDE